MRNEVTEVDRAAMLILFSPDEFFEHSAKPLALSVVLLSTRGSEYVFNFALQSSKWRAFIKSFHSSSMRCERNTPLIRSFAIHSWC